MLHEKTAMASSNDMTNDDAGRGGGRFRSGIFRFFATTSLVVGVLNVAYQELHQPSGIAKIAENNGLSGLSMGMSGDFELAVAHGATHIRVGSAIFGERVSEG